MFRVTTVDKSSWGEGAWQTECDFQAWIDEETQYPIVIKRGLLGAWIGLVGIDANHPLYLSTIGCTEFNFIEVHNFGITYVGFNAADDNLFEPPQKRWWAGFDCMQKGDYCPWREHPALVNNPDAHIGDYRDFTYITEQTEHLAYQLSTFDSRTYDDDIAITE